MDLSGPQEAGDRAAGSGAADWRRHKMRTAPEEGPQVPTWFGHWLLKALFSARLPQHQPLPASLATGRWVLRALELSHPQPRRPGKLFYGV